MKCILFFFFFFFLHGVNVPRTDTVCVQVAFSDGIAIFEGLKVMVGGARGGAKHFQLRFIVHARGEPQGEALATVDSIKFFGGSSTPVPPAMSRPTGKSFSG